MYLPQPFEETNPAALHELIRAHPFATLAVVTNEGLSVDHLPFLLDETTGPFGVLQGHIARANPMWKLALADLDAVAIFQGPHHYITPSWYETKKETGKVVPTWNYVVVHAYGRPRFIDDARWLRQHVGALTARHEASREEPWNVTDAPEEYVAKMAGAIVGIELPVVRLQGKWKLGQNRTEADREGMVAGLRAEQAESAHALSELIAGRQNRRP